MLKKSVFLWLMLLGLHAFSASASAAEAVSLQLKWKHAFQFAGFYMALEKGYYQEAGLDVTILEGGVGKSSVEHVLAHEGAYAVSGSGALLAFAQGKPIQTIAAIFQHSPLALLVKEDSGIHSFADLRGKRIMMQPRVQDVDVWAALQYSGLGEKDFTLQPQSFALQDLVGDKTDAFSAYITDQPHQLSLMGIPYRTLYPRDEAIDFYGDTLITSTAEVKKHAQRVHAMLDASMRGWVYALDHVDEAVDLIMASYNTQQLPREHLMFEAKTSAQLIMRHLVQVGYMNMYRWRDIAQVYVSQGLVAEDFDVESFVYVPENGLLEFAKEHLWFFLFAFLVATLIVAGGAIAVLRRAVRLKTHKLKESESLYRQMVESSPEPIAIHCDGLWVYANPASMHVFGATHATDIVGKSVFDFIHPDFHALVLSRMGEFVDGEVKPMLEEKLLRCDGATIWAEVTALSLVYKGKPSAMALTRDITVRKLQEEKDALYHQKMNALRDVLEQLNMAKTVSQAYEAAIHGASLVLGSDQSALLSFDEDKKLHFSAWHGLSSVYRDAFDGYAPWTQDEDGSEPMCIENIHENKRIEAWMVEANVLERIQALAQFPLVGGKGLFGSLVVYFAQPHTLSADDIALAKILSNDLMATVERIEELAETERKIERERLNMQVILDNAPLGIWMLDVGSRIQFVNKAFTETLGISEKMFMDAKHYSELLPTSVADICIASDQRCFAEACIVTTQEPLPCTDGETHIFDMLKAPIYDHQGRLSGLVGIAVDATERLVIEAGKEHIQHQIEHRQRLESLGVLAGGIAHDFNNILTAIMANAVIAERKVSLQPQLASENLNKVVQSAERAALLCKQMLAYSGKGHFVVKGMDLSALVAEITPLLEASIHHGITLDYALAALPLWVEADEAQLQQVIMNLVINAAEAMGEGNGVIQLSTGVEDVDEACLLEMVSESDMVEGKYAYLQVVDTGCGMDEATQEKLFDPFFTTKFTGRGLGMSAVLGIVRGHHGGMKVDSDVDKGTTFTLFFPMVQHDEDAESMESIVHHEAASCSGTILIIDDDEDIRDVASAMLEDLGFATLLAEDGIQGVEVYRQRQADISAVLLDMTMPRLGGKGCFKALRAMNADIKVVLSSGYDEKEAVGAFDAQGLAGFVQKPYMPEDLEAVMREVTKATNI
ncbi:MAG: ABC transporter substrate-binding protein [Ghiorsea sp.]